MNTIGSLLIVAASVAAPIDARYPTATPVFQSSFEESSDTDYDGWPEGWRRRKGTGYPHYLQLLLSAEPSPAGKRCWRFELNGGAAAAWSPPERFDIGSEYVAEAYVKTEGLRHDEACVALRFLDAQFRELQSEFGPRLRHDTAWTKVRVGPARCEHVDARYVVVELRLGPTDTADLKGSASFDDVWLGRLPRKNVRGSRPFNVFREGEPIELSLTLTGMVNQPATARLDIYDREGKLVASDERPATELVAGEFDPKLRPDPQAIPPQRFTWKPKLTDIGFYRGQVFVLDEKGNRLHDDATSLVIVERIEQLRDRAASADGEFGWSIPRAADVPTVDQLHVLLHESGVRRLKYPIWYDANDAARRTEVRRFVERMNVQGVGVIGTLTPGVAPNSSYQPSDLSAVQTFRKPRDQWFPTIEPVLLDLAFKVRGWQLGDDRDLGFLNLPGAAERVAAVKKELDRLEQDSVIGTPWTWEQTPPATEAPAWRFLSLSSAPELTAEELAVYLKQKPPESVARWVALGAVSPNDYPAEERVRDLVERVLTAKAAGVDGVYFVAPFDRECGLFEPGGTPTDLYLPWRTVTALVDGTRAAVPLTLPGMADIRMFVGSRSAMLVLTAPTPAQMTAELPGDVRFIDLWGRKIEPRGKPGERVVDVGPTPILALGVDREVARWSESCALQNAELREAFGGTQSAGLDLTNTFAEPVQGKVTLVPPEGWSMQPRSFDISLGAGEKLRLPFDLTLPVTAQSGEEMLRIDHELTGDVKRTFSLYRRVHIGNRELRLEVETRLVGDELEVEQRLVNNTDRSVSFRFDLFAPNQKRVRMQAYDMPPGTDVRTYRLPDGPLLQGKLLWIRAEEIDGTRVLSKRFVAGETP
jgi:hypothetical protein